MKSFVKFFNLMNKINHHQIGKRATILAQKSPDFDSKGRGRGFFISKN
jgi:hypothetical protein